LKLYFDFTTKSAPDLQATKDLLFSNLFKLYAIKPLFLLNMLIGLKPIENS